MALARPCLKEVRSRFSCRDVSFSLRRRSLASRRSGAWSCFLLNYEVEQIEASRDANRRGEQHEEIEVRGEVSDIESESLPKGFSVFPCVAVLTYLY